MQIFFSQSNYRKSRVSIIEIMEDNCEHEAKEKVKDTHNNQTSHKTKELFVKIIPK